MKNTILFVAMLAAAFDAKAQSIRALYPAGVDEGVSIKAIGRNGNSIRVVGNTGSSIFDWTGSRLNLSENAEVTGCSSDGNIIAGYTPATETTVEGGPVTYASNLAFVKIGAAAPVTIPPPVGYDYIVTHALSGNGVYLLITAYRNDPVTADQFRWSPGAGYQALGRYSNDLFVESVCPNVDAITDDGSTIIGWAASQLPPIQWTNATGWTTFADDAWVYNEGCVGVNGDATIVLGNQLVNDVNDREVPWRWMGGTKTALPAVVSGDSFYLYQASAAGNLAIGQNRQGSVRTPAVWQLGIGTRAFAEILPVTIDTNGWVFQRVAAVSKDGKVFAGEGTFEGRDAVFVVSLDSILPPAPTPPPLPTPTPSPTPVPKPAVPKVSAFSRTTTKPTVQISGTAANASTLEFSVNKNRAKKAPIKSGRFKFSVRLVVGKNSIRLRARGLGGVSGWKTVEVRRLRD